MGESWEDSPPRQIQVSTTAQPERHMTAVLETRRETFAQHQPTIGETRSKQALTWEETPTQDVVPLSAAPVSVPALPQFEATSMPLDAVAAISKLL